MTPSHRAWAERFVADLEARLARYARIGLGREGEAVIVASLQHVVDRYRAMFVVPIAINPVPAAPAADHRSATAWSDPVFWQDGRFDPFAGTRADRMRSSAATCRILGYDAAAVSFDIHAIHAAGAPVVTIAPDALDAAAQVHLATITPFVAGPQLALFG